MENKIPKEIEETTQRQVQSLDRALDKMAKMEERFDQIDKRFDEVIEQLDRIKKKQVEINKVKRWVWIAIIIFLIPFLIPIVIGILNLIAIGKDNDMVPFYSSKSGNDSYLTVGSCLDQHNIVSVREKSINGEITIEVRNRDYNKAKAICKN